MYCIVNVWYNTTPKKVIDHAISNNIPIPYLVCKCLMASCPLCEAPIVHVHHVSQTYPVDDPPEGSGQLHNLLIKLFEETERLRTQRYRCIAKGKPKW